MTRRPASWPKHAYAAACLTNGCPNPQHTATLHYLRRSADAKPHRHIHAEVHGPAVVRLRTWREPLSVRLDAWLDRHRTLQAFLAGVIVGGLIGWGAWCLWRRL